jgi:putative RNA 2'-phosphotransferase
MSNKSELIKISKFLSFILRHSPKSIHIDLDEAGWTDVDQLILNANKYGQIGLNYDLLKEVVAKNDKQRFTISGDGKKIRASQGHSISVELGLEAKQPPDELFHGTAERFLESIRRDGLLPQSRLQVHLSSTTETAEAVGLRHGKPVVLRIDTKAMYDDGCSFYLSDNKVWLVDTVPVKYIKNFADKGEGK